VLGRPSGRKQVVARAVQVLEAGQLGRLVAAGVRERDLVAGDEQVGDGRLADRAGAADEQDARGHRPFEYHKTGLLDMVG
jgi:hypothetical protein